MFPAKSQAQKIKSHTLMHIAIDASRTTVQRVTGTEHYARELIRHLIPKIEYDTEHRLTLYFRDTPSPDLFPKSTRIKHCVIPFARAWTHVRFAAQIWRDRPDVTFVPAHTLPLIFPGRAVVTVHDLGFKYFPEAHKTRDRRYLDWTTRYSASRAQIVLADSRATADDLTKFYGTPSEKIRVVYPGVEALSVRNIRQVQRVREKYKLPARYFVFVGTLQPRKNIARIVQAFQQFQQMYAQDPSSERVGLVLAGGQGWLYDPAWTAGVDNLYLTGYIDDSDKTTLYSGAIALVFPSLYEGFGFPVLEAMHTGTPVIASNTSSLPELVGEAGLLVDPLDVNAIAAAMKRLAESPDLYLELQRRGYEQAQRFNWETAAAGTLAALEAAANLSKS